MLVFNFCECRKIHLKKIILEYNTYESSVGHFNSIDLTSNSLNSELTIGIIGTVAPASICMDEVINTKINKKGDIMTKV